MADIAETIREQRRELRKKLPAAAKRVFALEGVTYEGCGFYYGLVKDIGGLLFRVNDFDRPYPADRLVLDEVIYEDLIERLDRIEASL
jgi:hypothetical protein